MDCNLGRNVELARIGGQILVNGYPKVHKTFAHVEGYVEEIGSYAPFMTVRETVEFSAAMRLGKKVSTERRKAFVEEVGYSPSILISKLKAFCCMTYDVGEIPTSKAGRHGST